MRTLSTPSHCLPSQPQSPAHVVLLVYGTLGLMSTLEKMLQDELMYF